MGNIDMATEIGSVCIEDYLDQPKFLQALTASCLNSFAEDTFLGKILIMKQITIFYDISQALKNYAKSEQDIQIAFWNMATLFDMVWKRFTCSLSAKETSELTSISIEGKTNLEGNINKDFKDPRLMEKEVIPSWLAGIKSCIYGIAKHESIRRELMRIYSEVKQLGKVLS